MGLKEQALEAKRQEIAAQGERWRTLAVDELAKLGVSVSRETINNHGAVIIDEDLYLEVDPWCGGYKMFLHPYCPICKKVSKISKRLVESKRALADLIEEHRHKLRFHICVKKKQSQNSSRNLPVVSEN